MELLDEPAVDGVSAKTAGATTALRTNAKRSVKSFIVLFRN
jgi:hypothetical protein